MGMGPGAGSYANLGAAGQEFPMGQLVWAKMPSYPWWPAQVSIHGPNIRLQRGFELCIVLWLHLAWMCSMMVASFVSTAAVRQCTYVRH